MTFQEIQTRLEPYADDLKPAPSAGWRDKDRVARLKRLWEDGHSASEIARMMGGGITRNAVIGKAHRIGLSGRIDPTTFRQRVSEGKRRSFDTNPDKLHAAQDRARRMAVKGLSAIAAKGGREPPAFVTQAIAADAAAAQLVQLLDLEPHHCRWPIGDPGHPKSGPLSYCETHAREAYAPSQHQRPPEAIHWNFPSPVKVARRAA